MTVYRISVRKVALEMILKGAVYGLVHNHAQLTREELHTAVMKIVQADFDKMNEATFRIKYVDYIRNYWGTR